MNDHFLKIKNVSLEIDKKPILKNIDLNLSHGEIACLLGPSGCGKTSLLRIIAGLENRATGEIVLNEKMALSPQHFLAPQKRNIGMVFQDYSLFPHLNVAENILFGLSKQTSKEQQRILERMLELTKLKDYKKAYPHNLSGGQQQRVALARALAQSPTLLLLDEPFSSLDLELRYKLADEVQQILKELKMAAILVTHDQTEAFSFAEKIAVMREGKIEQFSYSYHLYHDPITPFVAEFIGEGKIVDGHLLQEFLLPITHKIKGKILIRPDDVIHDDNSSLKGLVTKKIFRGSHFLYELSFPNGLVVYSLVQSHHDHHVGDHIGLRFELDHVVEFN